MNRAEISIITKELTAEQQTAHNRNYDNLANKDMEIYDEIDIKIQSALGDGKINDNMIGLRIACDPDNTKSSEQTTYMGNISQWLEKLSSRIVSAWGLLSAHLSNSKIHAKVPDGIFIGVINNNANYVFLPIAITIPQEQSVLPKYFFRVSANVSSVGGIGINFSHYDEAASNFINSNAALCGADNTIIDDLFAGVLYVLTPEIVGGVFKMYIREALEDDFII